MTVNVNGVTLFYETYGRGTPLVMLHGNGEDHRIFDALAETLTDAFTIYALDSRNHGQSQQTGEYAYRTMAEDVFAFLRALRLPKVNLLGFSDGAIISLLLAMAHGESVHKMALLGINLSPHDFTEATYRAVKSTYDETGDPLFKMMLEQPDIPLDEVRHVAAPALVIAGEHDICAPETFFRLADALPQGELLLMPGHSHDSYLVHQALLYPALIRFFTA